MSDAKQPPPNSNKQINADDLEALYQAAADAPPPFLDETVLAQAAAQQAAADLQAPQSRANRWLSLRWSGALASAAVVMLTAVVFLNTADNDVGVDYLPLDHSAALQREASIPANQSPATAASRETASSEEGPEDVFVDNMESLVKPEAEPSTPTQVARKVAKLASDQDARRGDLGAAQDAVTPTELAELSSPRPVPAMPSAAQQDVTPQTRMSRDSRAALSHLDETELSQTKRRDEQQSRQQQSFLASTTQARGTALALPGCAEAKVGLCRLKTQRYFLHADCAKGYELPDQAIRLRPLEEGLVFQLDGNWQQLRCQDGQWQLEEF